MEFMSEVVGGEDALKASVFEIVAQSKLNDMLEPAIRQLTSACAHRYPRYLVRILNKHEEWFAFLMFFVEKYYLSTNGGTFAENFFGLKRERVKSINGIKKLTRKDVYMSAILQVLLPWAQKRSEQLYENLGGNVTTTIFSDTDSDGDENLTKKEKVKKLFRKKFLEYYPKLYFGSKIIKLLYYILYMFDKTVYSSITDHILGLRYRRMTISDYRDIERNAIKSTFSTLISDPSGNRGWFTFIRTALLVSTQKIFDGLKVALPMSIFFYKFLDWWYKSDFYKSSQTKAIPPPPEVNQPHPDGIGLPEDIEICPICLKKRTNDAAIPSGYVFCYPCIHKRVEETSACPITLKPTRMDQIIKIYS